MGLMIVKMTAAMLIYVLITALVWKFWQKSGKGLRLKILIGILYGLCSVASTHFGTDYRQMVVNVRDLGPLASGLLISPVSGVIAGLIGGVERYIAGMYWGIGTYTSLACSVSTCLAGFFAAFLSRFILRGNRPTVLQALFIGSVMEVFHMYAILISHRNSIRTAYTIVRNCSVPMIVFSGLGMALCSFVVLRMSGGFRWELNMQPREETPIAFRFQRWLFLVILVVFTIDFWMAFNFQTRMAYQDAASSLRTVTSNCRIFYERVQEDSDPLGLLEQYASVDSASICLVYDTEGNIVVDSLHPGGAGGSLSERDMTLLAEQEERILFTASPEYSAGSELLCIKRNLDDKYTLVAGKYSEALYEGRLEKMYEIALSDILLVTAVYILISLLSERLIVRNLQSVNSSLSRIIDGNLDETVDVRDSLEFSALSDDINKTVVTLKGYIEDAERQMEYELHLAETIQESAVPRVFTFPRNDFEIYALMFPAKQVGGDFYDFFFIDSDRLVLVIADVSGKSIPAALFMMRAKTSIGNMARTGNSPAELLYNVNNILCEGNEAEMFVTVWVGIIDLLTGEMCCANAGHEYPVIRRAGGTYELFKDSHSLALAALENTKAKEYELKLNPGDSLFVYTDGVPEAINEAEEQYGTDRMLSILNSKEYNSQDEILHEVHRDIKKFAGKADQFDDITMLGFAYYGPDGKPETGKSQAIAGEEGNQDVTGESKEISRTEGLS